MGLELLEDRRLLSIDSPLYEGDVPLGQNAAISAELQPLQDPPPTDGGSAWPMKFRDIYNTGRADFSISADRLNDSFFDIFAWQKRTPNSPGEGNLDSTSMVFFDGAGPGNSDIVVGGYHWPKGVQGMDRHTGELFWTGNTAGGESIGTNTPAFSSDGSTIYVTSDYNGTSEYPDGFPLMAFQTVTGPGTFWHNGVDQTAHPLNPFSPKIAPDGKIFLHNWNDRPYAATDNGTNLTRTWAAQSNLSSCYNNPALYEDNSVLSVVAAGRGGEIKSFDGSTGAEHWSVNAGVGTDADPTIDPANGNIYIPVGYDDIFVVGLTKNGSPLWGGAPKMAVYDWISGQNNPQRAQSTGCLSQDGSTFYFQTNSQEGDGRLYAINTANGTVKWSFATGSRGGEMNSSSPIVTPNGIVIVGNNEGDTYYAIRDAGTSGQLIDSLVVDAAGVAEASATLSADGFLYLPLRVAQNTGAKGESPSFHVENLFSAIDLTTDAVAKLYPPGGQSAVALNHVVSLSWIPLNDTTGQFQNYAIYRSTAAFSTVQGMTLLATVSTMSDSIFTDNTAINGTHYYYAITSVSLGGGEIKEISSIGPCTPRDETDLQIISIARSPQYPRFAAEYSVHTVTEPSGFGPYIFSESDGLGNGQTFDTQRFPHVGDSVTYTATIRNRGTNSVNGILAGSWILDGIAVANPTQIVSLAPGASANFQYFLAWDDQPHSLVFTIDTADARPENNSLESDTLAVPFLTYVDRSFIETFRETWSPTWPGAKTDDVLDWLNMQMNRFNELFAAAGSPGRVHYDVLQVLDDNTADPAVDISPYAIFPLRYRAGVDGDPRGSGYYRSQEDIDYGLLHEMGHQLGLIDLYQLDVPAEANQVSGLGYNGPDCLMRTCADFLSENSALAMTHWLNEARGYFGQYLYGMPETMKLRLLGFDGNPLVGATVTAYQYCERPGEGKVISNQIKFQGITNANGLFTLPNVPIDNSLIPAVGTGDVLHPNPFGYVACVGTNGVLHFRIEYNGGIDYAWLDITETNVAYWKGQTTTAVFERQLALGGELRHDYPPDMAEMNAVDWSTWAQGATASITEDTSRKLFGESSLKFTTDGGFDTYLRYPRTYTAQWDLTQRQFLDVSFYAENPNFSFQNASPWIRLKDAEGNYFQYQYYENGNPVDLLNDANNTWKSYQIPLNASSTNQNGWRRTSLGSPNMANIQSLEIHADTWGYGFNLWIDGVTFDGVMGTSGNDVIRIIRNAADANLADVFVNNPGTDPTYSLNLSGLPQLSVFGSDGDDQLIADLSRGNPLPVGGLVFDGGNHIIGDELVIEDSSSNDDMTLTATQVILNGLPAMNYSRVEFFAFDLAGGTNNLTIDHTTLNINRDNAISAGVNLIVDGGVLNFNGHSQTIGYLTVIDNGQANVTAINNTATTVTLGTLTATSIVCDTLTIGSTSETATNADTMNTAVLLRDEVPQSIASNVQTSIAADSTPTASTQIDSPVIEEQPIAAKVNAITAFVTLAASIPYVSEALQLAPSAPVVSQKIPVIVSAAGLPDRMEQQNIEPLFVQPQLEESFTWEFNADLYLVTRFDNKRSPLFSSSSFMTDRLRDSVYAELIESLAVAKKQSSAVMSEYQNAHNLALQTLMTEFQRNRPVDQEESDLLAGKHGRKHDKLVQKDVDDFYSQLVACD